MKGSLYCLLLVFFKTCAFAQPLEVYKEISKNHYCHLVLNPETKRIDTLHLILNDNNQFVIYRVGNQNRVIVTGNWQKADKLIVLHNRYPLERPLSVRVLPVVDCNEYLPDLTDSSGGITHEFYMDARHNTYNAGMIIPYKELDTIRDHVRICSNDGNYCSDIFSIPYTSCYRIVVDMDVNPNEYNGTIKTMYFRKRKDKLELVKSEKSEKW